jgi:predicted ester cyclase
MEKQNGSAKLAKQKEVMKKVYSAFETGNTSELGNYFTNDVKEHTPDPSMKSTGIQMVKDQIELYHTAFPDTKIKINEIFGDGEKLTIYSTFTGTNTGSFMGSTPTNKKVTVNGIEIVKFTDDKITDHWGVYDNMSMMMQLGLVPSFEEMMKHEAHH